MSYLPWTAFARRALPILRTPGIVRAMFHARTRPGRWVKGTLFVVGAVLPLGSVIWALLAWHGSAALTRSEGLCPARSSLTRRKPG